MSKTIQIVPISDTDKLFIIDYNDGILTFRTTKNIQHLQQEKIKIEDNVVYTNLYFFHINFLNNFINLNFNHYKNGST